MRFRATLLITLFLFLSNVNIRGEEISVTTTDSATGETNTVTVDSSTQPEMDFFTSYYNSIIEAMGMGIPKGSLQNFRPRKKNNPIHMPLSFSFVPRTPHRNL